MPQQGKYTAADISQPPQQQGQYTAADIGTGVQATQPATQQQPPDSFFGGIGRRLSSMVSQQPENKSLLGNVMDALPGMPLSTATGLAQSEKQLGRQLVQQAKTGAASHKPGDILPNLNDARTAVTAASMLNPFAAGSVANVNQLQDQGRPNEAAGQGLTDAGLMGAGLGLSEGIPALKNALPDAARAGRAFQQVKAAAGDIPIDTTAPGNTALEIKRLAQSGGQMPKVVRDFITRATDPNQGPITYGEARDFYSNASRLSADEAQRLTPNMKRMAGQFRSDLGNSLQDAASQAGQGDVYQGAMTEYARAMKVQDFVDWLKQGAIKTGVGAAGGGVLGYGLKRILEGALKK